MVDVLFVDARSDDDGNCYGADEWGKCDVIGHGSMDEINLLVVDEEICLPPLLEDDGWYMLWVVCQSNRIIVGRT